MIMFRFRVSMFYLILLHFIFTRAQLARERMHLMNRHILHQNSSLCSEIKPENYETCELHYPDDNKPIRNQCVSEEERCSDGSHNRTCIILFMGENGTRSSMCSCHENKQPQVPTAEYHWSRWYTLTDSRVGLYRQMNDVLISEPPTLAKEYRCVQV